MDESDLKKVYLHYVAWRAKILTPEDPENAKDFCVKYKIEMTDIVQFVKFPTFEDDLLNATLAWAKGKTPQLIHAIFKEVSESKSVADLEKFLQLVYELKKKDKQAASTTFNFFNIPDERYKRIIAREAIALDSGSEE